MKIKNITDKIIETRYQVIMRRLDGSYEFVTMDYLHAGMDDFYKASMKLGEFSTMKHQVQFISINSETGMLEIQAKEIA